MFKWLNQKMFTAFLFFDEKERKRNSEPRGFRFALAPFSCDFLPTLDKKRKIRENRLYLVEKENNMYGSLYEETLCFNFWKLLSWSRMETRSDAWKRYLLFITLFSCHSANYDNEEFFRLTHYLLLKSLHCSCWWDFHAECSSSRLFIFNYHSYATE